jgi:hypothetical protein
MQVDRTIIKNELYTHSKVWYKYILTGRKVKVNHRTDGKATTH